MLQNCPANFCNIFFLILDIPVRSYIFFDFQKKDFIFYFTFLSKKRSILKNSIAWANFFLYVILSLADSWEFEQLVLLFEQFYASTALPKPAGAKESFWV